MEIGEVVEAFDRWLAEAGLSLEATVIGGAALVMLGITSRFTNDVDVLQPVLSEEVMRAAQGFSSSMRERGIILPRRWLNNGPRALMESMPEGWEARQRVLFEGEALRLNTLSEEDLLRTKLLALCDRNEDWADCLALTPSAAQLERACEWLLAQEEEPGWSARVEEVLIMLARRLGHGV